MRRAEGGLIRLTDRPVAAIIQGGSVAEVELYSKGSEGTVLVDMPFSLGRPIEGQLTTVLPDGSFWRGLIARARVLACPPSYFLVFPGLPSTPITLGSPQSLLPAGLKAYHSFIIAISFLLVDCLSF
jgi:hypothetical protein